MSALKPLVLAVNVYNEQVNHFLSHLLVYLRMHLLYELTHLMFLSVYNLNASQRLLSVLAQQQAISYQVLFNSVARSTFHSVDLYVSHANEFLLNLLLKIHQLFKILYGHLSLLRFLFPCTILRLNHSDVYTPRFLL